MSDKEYSKRQEEIETINYVLESIRQLMLNDFKEHAEDNFTIVGRRIILERSVGDRAHKATIKNLIVAGDKPLHRPYEELVEFDNNN